MCLHPLIYTFVEKNPHKISFMKHLHWAVLTDYTTNADTLQADLCSYTGCDVVARAKQTTGVAVGMNALLDECNALYVASGDASALPLCIMAMKRGIPVVLKDPVQWSYLDFIRLHRVSEEIGSTCHVDWRRIDMGVIDRLSHGLLQSSPTADEDRNCLRLLCQYQPSAGGWRGEVMYQCYLLQQLLGVIINAVGLSTHAEQTHSGVLLFENNVLCDALWQSCHADMNPLTCIEIYTGGKQHSVRLNPDGSALIDDKDVINASFPLLRQITEELQGFNVCESTVTKAASCAWVVERLCSE